MDVRLDQGDCERCNEPISPSKFFCGDWAVLEIHRQGQPVHRERIHLEHLVTVASKLRWPVKRPIS